MSSRHAGRLALLLAMATLGGCAHLLLEDCPKGGVLGKKEEARFRSSHYRSLLASVPAAAHRLAPYALMSAHAYRDGGSCVPEDKNRLPGHHARAIVDYLGAPANGAWTLVDSFGPRDNCEDETGLMLYAWTRVEGNRRTVVIVFRGTSGWRDWIYGNGWWFTRFFNEDDQLKRSRDAAHRIIRHYQAEARTRQMADPRFIASGHSLGGGLAQHILYMNPNEIEQAIVFNPSAVTGFVYAEDKDRRRACECHPDLKTEARILRVYETDEILANLRSPHKWLWPPERHVQEVRFAFLRKGNQIERHSMLSLATKLRDSAAAMTEEDRKLDWFAGKPAECTVKIRDAQARSCARTVEPGSWLVCPQ